MTVLTSRPDAPAPTVKAWPVVTFVGIAGGLAWLVALPLWIGDGLASPWFTPLAVAMMATPTIAALTMTLVERTPNRMATLGLWPVKPIGRVVRWSLLGIAGVIALALVALPVGAALGVYPADLAHLSGFRQTLAAAAGRTGGTTVGLPVELVAALQIASLPLGAVINVIPALGEEVGWRGWLWPRLTGLGTVPAILLSGVVWGLWHAPLILLGYNYRDAPGFLALTAMVITCILLGALFGWLRTRSSSVWPSAFAHAALNGAGGAYLVFARAGARVDTTQATILGWSGWIVPLLVVLLLLATGQFGSRARGHDPAHP